MFISVLPSLTTLIYLSNHKSINIFIYFYIYLSNYLYIFFSNYYPYIFLIYLIFYLDEEDKEKASDKWERKEMEKINKAQRLDKKKEEGRRMKKLVDNAFNSDPRIAK